MYDENALVIQFPGIIKARTEGDRRLVEIPCSNEAVDSEGDVIMQAALLDSGPSFLRRGHLDIDHISELGERLGIRNSSDYIIGNPLEVKDLGKGETSVLGELQRDRPKADEVWRGLTATPSVRWQASIYGFPLPGSVIDARVAKGGESMMGATRFLVKALDWRSLALTRNPINTNVGASRAMTVKSFMAVMKARLTLAGEDLGKADPMAATVMPIDYILPPRNRIEMMGHLLYHIKKDNCPVANRTMGSSVHNFSQHFMICCGMPEWEADIYALALMHLLKRERADDL